MKTIYITLARRYLLGKKGRSLMTLLGIALGVTMVVAVLLTNTAILDSYANLLASAAGRADLQVSGTTGTGFAERALQTVTATPGVAGAVPVVTALVPVAAGEKQGAATIYGIDVVKDQLIRDYHLVEGRLPAGSGSGTAGNELAVSSDMAQALAVRPGDELSLLTTRGMQAYRVVGRFDSSGTVRGALGPFAVMDVSEAQAAFGKAGRLDLIDLVVASGSDRATVRADLSARLDAAGVQVGEPAERSKDMASVIDSINFVLTMAGSISLFAGAFIIYTNVAMGVAERRRDLAALRALGMKRGELLRLVLGEAAFLGILGSGLGLLWGYGLASILAAQMTSQVLAIYGIQRTEVSLTLAAVAAAVIVGTGTAIFAAFGPARETAMISPVAAMRTDSGHREERSHFGWLRLLAGVAIIAVGVGTIWLSWPERGMLSPLMLRVWGLMIALVLLGVVVLLPALLVLTTRWLFRPLLSALFGITGRIAADNLVRQPRRTVATIASLMVSLTFMVGIGGVKASQVGTFTRWYDNVIAWDLNVSTSFAGLGAQVEMDPAFEQELAAVDGVRLVSPQKMLRINLADGKPAFLQVYDHHLLRQYSQTPLAEGDRAAAMDSMERGGGALISPPVARRLGAGIGDVISLPTPTGAERFTVRGIMEDVTSYGGTVQIDRQDYVRAWNDRTSTNIAVLVDKGQDPAAVRERIMSGRGESHLLIRLNREFWAELKKTYDGFYGLMDSLTWIAVMVSGLAIANTLFSSILERRREIGVMRALGTRRGEVVRVVAGEALGTGVMGGVMGILLGLAMMWAMTSATEFIIGNSTDLIIGWGAIGTATAVALLLAPLVSLLPARWAAQLEIVEALRYE